MNPRLSILLVFTFLSFSLSALPLFDTHVHYNQADRSVYSPEQIIHVLKKNDIRQALITASPPHQAIELYQADPQRIIPFLGVYRQMQDKQNWHQDTNLPDYVQQQLETGPWRGIGELHIFAKDRHSPVLHRLVQLAVQHQLPLLMHTDPAVIDTIYEMAPNVTVIWAHAGTYPYPDLLADYLRRYPGLMVDLSVRDELIAPDGTIRDAWYELFIRYHDRFMVGVDTYSTQRWQEYAEVTRTMRNWLAQLPQDVAEAIAYDTALALFKTTSRQSAD